MACGKKSKKKKTVLETLGSPRAVQDDIELDNSSFFSNYEEIEFNDEPDEVVIVDYAGLTEKKNEWEQEFLASLQYVVFYHFTANTDKTVYIFNIDYYNDLLIPCLYAYAADAAANIAKAQEYASTQMKTYYYPYKSVRMIQIANKVVPCPEVDEFMNYYCLSLASANVDWAKYGQDLLGICYDYYNVVDAGGNCARLPITDKYADYRTILSIRTEMQLMADTIRKFNDAEYIRITAIKLANEQDELKAQPLMRDIGSTQIQLNDKLQRFTRFVENPLIGSLEAPEGMFIVEDQTYTSYFANRGLCLPQGYSILIDMTLFLWGINVEHFNHAQLSRLRRMKLNLTMERVYSTEVWAKGKERPVDFILPEKSNIGYKVSDVMKRRYMFIGNKFMEYYLVSVKDALMFSDTNMIYRPLDFIYEDYLYQSLKDSKTFEFVMLKGITSVHELQPSAQSSPVSFMYGSLGGVIK